MVQLRLRVTLPAALVFVLALIAAAAAAKDLYSVLGVERAASDKDIRKAFYKLSLKYHPDKNPSKSAKAKFMEISHAYDVLSDPDKRRQYDLMGDPSDPPPSAHSAHSSSGRAKAGGQHQWQGGPGFSGFGWGEGAGAGGGKGSSGGNAYTYRFSSGNGAGAGGTSGKSSSFSFSSSGSSPFSFASSGSSAPNVEELLASFGMGGMGVMGGMGGMGKQFGKAFSSSKSRSGKKHGGSPSMEELLAGFMGGAAGGGPWHGAQQRSKASAGGFSGGQGFKSSSSSSKARTANQRAKTAGSTGGGMKGSVVGRQCQSFLSCLEFASRRETRCARRLQRGARTARGVASLDQGCLSVGCEARVALGRQSVPRSSSDPHRQRHHRTLTHRHSACRLVRVVVAPPAMDTHMTSVPSSHSLLIDSSPALNPSAPLPASQPPHMPPLPPAALPVPAAPHPGQPVAPTAPQGHALPACAPEGMLDSATASVAGQLGGAGSGGGEGLGGQNRAASGGASMGAVASPAAASAGATAGAGGGGAGGPSSATTTPTLSGSAAPAASGASAGGAAASSVSPCGACKFLRRKCTSTCIFAAYFSPDQSLRFANVHRIFGASNVGKLLQELPPPSREDAVNSLSYEAEARISDPVYGCVGALFALQQQVSRLARSETLHEFPHPPAVGAVARRGGAEHDGRQEGAPRKGCPLTRDLIPSSFAFPSLLTLARIFPHNPCVGPSPTTVGPSSHQVVRLQAELAMSQAEISRLRALAGGSAVLTHSQAQAQAQIQAQAQAAQAQAQAHAQAAAAAEMAAAASYLPGMAGLVGAQHPSMLPAAAASGAFGSAGAGGGVGGQGYGGIKREMDSCEWITGERSAGSYAVLPFPIPPRIFILPPHLPPLWFTSLPKCPGKSSLRPPTAMLHACWAHRPPHNRASLPLRSAHALIDASMEPTPGMGQGPATAPGNGMVGGPAGAGGMGMGSHAPPMPAMRTDASAPSPPLTMMMAPQAAAAAAMMATAPSSLYPMPPPSLASASMPGPGVPGSGMPGSGVPGSNMAAALQYRQMGQMESMGSGMGGAGGAAAGGAGDLQPNAHDMAAAAAAHMGGMGGALGGSMAMGGMGGGSMGTLYMQPQSHIQVGRGGMGAGMRNGPLGMGHVGEYPEGAQVAGMGGMEGPDGG
ncbi:unnamed protein product [Closterium sp. NIES-54]